MDSGIHAAAVLGACLAANAQAAPLVDQQHLPAGNFGALSVANDRTQVQTFSAGITGVLTRVDVKVERGAQAVEDLVLTVWNTNSNRLPREELVSASVQASAVEPTSNRVLVSIDLDAADVFVTQGSLFAITLDSAAENTEPFDEWAWQFGAIYFGGLAYTSIFETFLHLAEDFHFRTYVEPATEVTIDLRPHNDRNQVNLSSRGNLPVAVLTTNAFDATTVDPASVRLGLGAIRAAPSRYQSADLNGDRRPDLLLRFETEEAGLQCGQGSVSLTGRTRAGEPIFGTDTILTVGCPP